MVTYEILGYGQKKLDWEKWLGTEKMEGKIVRFLWYMIIEKKVKWHYKKKLFSHSLYQNLYNLYLKIIFRLNCSMSFAFHKQLHQKNSLYPYTILPS